MSKKIVWKSHKHCWAFKFIEKKLKRRINKGLLVHITKAHGDVLSALFSALYHSPPASEEIET